MEKTLKAEYIKLCNTISDINEHLPVIKEYASKYKHITEFGVRTWLSTIALLEWAPKWAKVFSFDIVKTPEIDAIWQLVAQAKKDWTFYKHSTSTIIIKPTNLLFIDTIHDYCQLKNELEHNHSQVSNHIILHDTTTFGVRWETEWCAWLWYAVEEFLYNHPEWEVEERYTNNNGLTILNRIGDVDYTEPKHKPIVCMYTAIYGNQDILKLQPQQTMDVKYICYTDNPDIICEEWAREQREIRVEQPFKHLHPRMQAKYYRTHPEVIWDYKYKIRIDWTCQLLRQDSIEYLLSQFLPKSNILCFKHPDRDCIYKEATFSWQIEKYFDMPLQAQVSHYKNIWMPEQFWLTATWLLITRWNEMDDFLHERWAECLTRTYQDQLSFDYLVRKYNIKRQWLKDMLRDNNHLTFLNRHLHEK